MSDDEAIKATAAEDADATYTRHFSDFVSSCGQVDGEVAWTTIAELLDRYNVPVLYRVYAHMVSAGPLLNHSSLRRTPERRCQKTRSFWRSKIWP